MGPTLLCCVAGVVGAGEVLVLVGELEVRVPVRLLPDPVDSVPPRLKTTVSLSFCIGPHAKAVYP